MKKVTRGSNLFYKKVAMVFREKRTEIGLSKSDLAKAVGCSYAHIKNIEENHYGLSLDMAMRISNVLDVPLDSFKSARRNKRKL